MKKILIGFIVGMGLIVCGAPLFAGEMNQYMSNLSHDYVRGVTNAVSAPGEIYLATERNQKSPGPAVFRQIAGLVDGTFRMIERAGCGLWDFVIMAIPGDQEGVHPDPEMLR